MLKWEHWTAIGFVALSACALGGGKREFMVSQSVSEPAPEIDLPPDDFPTTPIVTKHGSYSVPKGFYLAGTKPFQKQRGRGLATGTNYSLKTALPNTDSALVASLTAFDQPLGSVEPASLVSSALEQYPIKEAWDERSIEVPGALTPYTNRRSAMRQSGIDLALAIGGSVLKANGRDHFVSCMFVQKDDLPDPLLLAVEDKCMQLIMALSRSG